MAAELFIPPSKALDANANPYAGAKWFFYATGTTTPQSVYTTFAMGTAHANPVVADSSGKFANIFFDPALVYRGVLKNADESVTLHDIDPISSSTLAALAASDGSDLVGFLQAGTGAVARTGQAKMRDTVSIKDFGAVGDGVTNDTAAFTTALAYVDSLPAGGTIYVPQGIYVADIDASKLTQVFDKPITLMGAGRSSTTIYPAGSNGIMLNMQGRNEMTVRDLTLRSGTSFAADCGIYLGRCTTSTNANNNKFINVYVFGNFNKHAVVSCAAESSLWDNCKFRVTTSSGTASNFWTGLDPAKSGVTPTTGTPSIGPNTDNRMVNCEVYCLVNGCRNITVSEGGGWVFENLAHINGGANDVQMFRLESNSSTSGGVFNGPLYINNNHFEVFGTGNVGIYVAGNGIQYIYEVHLNGGFAVTDNNFVMADFNRNQNLGSGGSYFYHSTFNTPADTSGLTAGLPLYSWAMSRCKVNWRSRQDVATAVIFAFAQECEIVSDILSIGSLAQTDVIKWSDAVPTSGTYARGQRVKRSYQTGPLAVGDVTEWIAYTRGTLGTLNGGATTASVINGSQAIVFSSATGLRVGQALTIGGGDYTLASLSGVNGILSVPYIAATAPAQAVAFTATGFSAVGVLDMARGTTVAAPAGGATVDTECRAQLAALLTSLKTANVIAT